MEIEIIEGKLARAIRNPNHRFENGEDIEFVRLNSEDYGVETPVYSFKSVKRELEQDLVKGEFEWI